MPQVTEQILDKITFLLAQNASGYGPPSDYINVDVVVQLSRQPGRGLGFQLRNDNNLPANQAMFALLQQAYINNLAVQVDVYYTPPAHNAVIFRAALTKLG